MRKTQNSALLEHIPLRGIVLFLFFILLVLYLTKPSVSAPKRANAEIWSIQTLKQGIQNFYSQHNNYQDLSNTALIKAKSVPYKMTIDNNFNSLINSFGGEVVITNAKNDISELQKNYKIIYPDIPNAECVLIALGVEVEFSHITINDYLVKNSIGNFKLTHSKELIQHACTQDSNTLIFYGF